LGIQLLKSFQLQGAPEPLTRGSAPETRWGLGPRPPVHGFASVEIKSWTALLDYMGRALY